MRFIDKRNLRDFQEDMKHVKRIRPQTFVQYYSHIFKGEVGILLACTLTTAGALSIVHRFVKQFGSANLICLYLALYVLTVGSVALTIGSFVSHGYKPYFVQRLAFEQLLFSLVSSRDYYDVLEAFCNYDGAMIPERHSDRNWLYRLKCYCEQGVVSADFAKCNIAKVKSTDKRVQLTMGDAQNSIVELPLAKHVYGEEPLLVLTDNGAILQLPA